MIKLNTLKKMSLSDLRNKAAKLDCPIAVNTADRSELIQFIFDDQFVEEEITAEEEQTSGDEISVSLEGAESKSLKALRKSVTDADINYIPNIAFPMHWTPSPTCQSTFTFASGNVLELSRTAIYYLRYINRSEITYAEITDMLENGDYKGIAELTLHEKFSKKLYIAAIWHKQIVGFLTNYNQVDTTDLINMVVENGLGNDVQFTEHNQYDSKMFINVRPSDASVVKTFVRITNGHNGQVSLNYSQGVRVGEFVHFWKYSGGRRVHLSKVGLGVAGLMSAIEETKEIKFNEKLQAMTFEGVLTTMQGSNLVDSEKFQEFCKQQRGIMAMGSEYIDNFTVVSSIANKINEHGFKSVVRKALENIFNGML